MGRGWMTMNPDPGAVATDQSEFRYHLLRAAGERFQAGVVDLSEAQLGEVTRQARRTFELEDLVLGSAEARGLVIPPDQVAAAVAAVRGRYRDTQEFRSDLERNGLDLEGLHLALRRELTFDAVMQRVGSRHAGVDELEERLFYDVHQERFTVAERRTARHLLITVNDEDAESRRDLVQARIERLAEQVRGPADGRTQRFEALARRHSQCPTALEGGRLGEVVPGQLYPALDAALFALPAGDISGPVESELGFHLLLCERIQPGRSIPFTQARPQVRALLEERARRHCQKAWIGGLRQGAAGSVAKSPIDGIRFDDSPIGEQAA